MAKTLDDVYRKVLWQTSLTTNDLPYVYSGGGNTGFLELFSEQYKYLVNQAILVDTNYFTKRKTDNLVVDQEIYYFPADMIRLRHLELSYDGSYFWPATELDPVFFKRGSEQATVSAAYISHPYFWLGDSITSPSSPYHIAPRPNAAQTSGILYYYDQMPMGLLGTHVSAAISAASVAVVFPEQFEYLLPLGISVELWGKYGVREQKADEIARYQKGLDDMRNMMKPRASVGQKRVRDFREINTKDV